MRAFLDSLPVTIQKDGVIIREAEWGDFHIGHETYETDFDVGPLLKGLPDDMCQCPHWGYVIRGRMRVRYPDGDEIVEAGSAYYLPPGHAPVMESGTEVIEFSPREPFQETMEVATRNFIAMQEAYKRQR
jgi:hypothetical protein